jgi:hypothetical protein
LAVHFDARGELHAVNAPTHRRYRPSTQHPLSAPTRPSLLPPPTCLPTRRSQR